MSDPSISAVSSSAPSPMSEEPVSITCSENRTLVCACVDPSSDGDGGAGGAGARALVECFGGNEGAGGAGEAPEMPGDGLACSKEALTAAAVCGSAIAAAASTGGVAALFAGFGCLAALDGYAECRDKSDAPQRSGR